MGPSEKSSLIIYRCGDKGLEVFMLNPDQEGITWELPTEGVADGKVLFLDGDRIIELDPVEQEDGLFEQAYAVEADWHDIPSLKSILQHDVNYMKNTIKQMVPDAMKKGAFVAVKEAFKKVLPHQYNMLKELKDIIVDRNLTKNI
jgi:predicted NUDIX family NTP pyrophosphohydrolase